LAIDGGGHCHSPATEELRQAVRGRRTIVAGFETVRQPTQSQIVDLRIDN
jgi:hypothetical protein